jgi:hypothetical protein
MGLESRSGYTALQSALAQFQDSLNDRDRLLLGRNCTNPDVSAVLSLTQHLDEKNRNRKRAGVASRLSFLLDAVQRFSSVIETIVSADPFVAARVWGSIKFALLVSSDVVTYFEKLSALFMEVHSDYPLFHEYQALFPDSLEVQSALCIYFASVVTFCREIVICFRKLTGAAILSAIWKPFEARFGLFRDELRRNCKQVRHELKLADTKAAAEARELQILESKRNESFRHRMLWMSDKDREHKRVIDQRMARSNRQRWLKQLSDLDYRKAYLSAGRKRHWSTRPWLNTTPLFQKWMTASSNSVLWCHGSVGVGKSVLCASTIDLLTKRTAVEKATLIYFMCQFNVATSLTAVGIIGSFCRQILELRKIKADEDELEMIFKFSEPQLEMLTSFLVRQLQSCGPVFVVLDGVDECAPSDREIVFQAMYSGMRKANDSIHLLISSRTHIQEQIVQIFGDVPRIPINVSDLQADIKVFVDTRLDELYRDGTLKIGKQNDKLLQEIKSVILEKSDGL